jgi:integrative and conjugative element protein (TIGR02256 family)
LYDRVVIDAGARSALWAHVSVEPERETGGILLGYAADEHTLRVTAVSPPGPRALKMPFFFRRDTKFLQRWLERRCELSGGQNDYVGEWHVHHALDAPPSTVDRCALWRIARRPNYPTTSPLLIIVEDVSGDRRIRGYEFTARRKCAYREVAVS